MIKELTKKQIKTLYEITKKEKYHMEFTTPELLKLCHVEYQEKLDFLTEKMKECDLGIFKTAEYFSYEERKKNLLRDECWDLQWKLEHFEECLENELKENITMDIDDEDCCYIDELEEKN